MHHSRCVCPQAKSYHASVWSLALALLWSMFNIECVCSALHTLMVNSDQYCDYATCLSIEYTFAWFSKTIAEKCICISVGTGKQQLVHISSIHPCKQTYCNNIVIVYIVRYYRTWHWPLTWYILWWTGARGRPLSRRRFESLVQKWPIEDHWRLKKHTNIHNTYYIHHI